MQRKKPLKDTILKCRRKCIVPLPPPFQELSLKKESGDRLYDFLEGNVLQTKKPVYNMNFDRLIGYKDENGSKYYEFPRVKFREAMIKRYGNRAKELHPPIGSPFAIH